MDKIPINVIIEKVSHLLSIFIHCKVKNEHNFLLSADATTISSIFHRLFVAHMDTEIFGSHY